MKALPWAALALSLLAVSAVSSALADSPTGQINFFDVSGTGATSTCTSTIWNGGTFSDGNIGFGGNLGPSNVIPIVGNGEEMCIMVHLHDQSPNTAFTISSGNLILLTGTDTFNTNSSGDATGYGIFNATGLSGDCSTHPIFVSPDIQGTPSTHNQIHHFYGGSGACGGTPPHLPPPSTVPQFPLGMGLLLLALVPALFVMKKKMLPTF
ncbi:MAG: hypothetical protein JRM80_11045 [Nitrososphaerota archaeon]|nr:hypothetical protein [Nitrososphaerota archaeon]